MKVGWVSCWSPTVAGRSPSQRTASASKWVITSPSARAPPAAARWRPTAGPARPPAGPRPAGRRGARSRASPAAGLPSRPWLLSGPRFLRCAGSSPSLPRLGRRESGFRDPRAARKDLLQVEGDRPLELLVGAGGRLAVRPPAAELGGVAGPPALHVVVGDLDHQLRGQRLPGEVLVGVPARQRSRDPLGRDLAEPRVGVARLQAVGRQLVEQLAPPLHREGGRHADVLQLALLVVEAEQQRADHPALLVP